MSPLRKSLREAAAAWLMLALTAFGLAWPALHVLPMGQEMPRVGLLCLAIAAMWVWHSAPERHWLRLLWFAVSMLGVFFIIRTAFPGMVTAARALMDGHPAGALLLYGDALSRMGVVVLCLVCSPIVMGDPAFSAPLYLSMLLILWLMGARGNLAAYLPGAAALPMLFVYARSRESGREPGAQGGTARRAIPVVAVLAALALLLTPAYRTAVPALEQRADRLRQWIEDYFFFIDSRNMFSLRGMGWQPLGSQRLGGRPMVSPAAVMSVTTDRKVYLRGAILDHYTGGHWRDTISSDRYGYNSIRFAGLRDSLINANLPLGERLDESQVSVRMLASAPSTLFTPQRVRKLHLGEGLMPYFNAASELFVTRDLREGDAWRVTYEPYVAGRAGTNRLARALRGVTDPDYADIVGQYTQLPPHLPPDGVLAQFAREITRGVTDPYSQALALQDYLRRSFAYTLDVPEPPRDMDFVGHFLFETGKGYCTYFASAMTVLCRSVGLPARYIEGFSVMPAPSGAAVVTGEDAHAWTEVYIAGLGWVTFDATASQQDDPGGQGEPEEVQPEPSASPTAPPTQTPPPGEDAPEDDATPTPPPPADPDTPEPSPGELPQEAPEDQPPGPPRFPWWLLALCAAALFLWRMAASAPDRRAARADGDGARVLIYWQAACEALRARGQGQRDSETMLEYARRALPADAQRTAETAAAIVYGRAGADARDAQAARGVYLTLWRELPALGRARLALARAGRDMLSIPGRVGAMLARRARGMRHRNGRGGNHAV